MDKQTKKHLKYLNTVIDNLSNLLEYYECKLIEYRKALANAKIYPTGNINNPVGVFCEIKEKEKDEEKTKQYKIFAVNPYEMFALLYQGKELKGRINKTWNRLDDCFHQLDEPIAVSIKYKVYEYYTAGGDELVGSYIEISKEEDIYKQLYLRDKIPQGIKEIINICNSLELEYECE